MKNIAAIENTFKDDEAMSTIENSPGKRTGAFDYDAIRN